MASAGKILLMPKGEYDSGTAYSVLDWVRYGGKAWVCKQNSTGNTPAENAYWAELCADGIDGQNGESYYMYIRYSENSDGAGFVSVPTVDTIYIGFYTGNSNTAPADKAAYTWSRYVGSGGGGTGAWPDIIGKPFNSVGSDGLKVTSGALDVDLTKVQAILADATTSTSGKMSAEDKTKLDGIATGANNYTLPTMSDTVKGGAKVGTGLSMDGETLNSSVAGLIDDETDFWAQTGSTSKAVDSFILKEILDEFDGGAGGAGNVIYISTDETDLYMQEITATSESGEIATAKFNVAGQATLYAPFTGVITLTSSNSAETETAISKIVSYNFTRFDVVMKFNELYGFCIDTTNNSPINAVTYLTGYDNDNYAPVKMNYTTGVFDYGDWENAFFIKESRWVMLKSDGTIDYDLDKNDHTKKASDGSASDVSNDDYDGNAMFGLTNTYIKYWQESGDSTKIYVAISKKPLEGFKNYAHHDNDGNTMPYTFIRMFEGTLVSGKLRSIANNATPLNSVTGTVEIGYAQANGDGWYTGLYNDRTLVNMLLVLMGKSLDTQTVYGNGHYTGGSAATNLLKAGTMTNKGLFWGANGTGSGVKVFGMENWWGNLWERIGGYMYVSNVQTVKLTHGTEDGSTAVGYNTTGAGYISIPASVIGGTSEGYISAVTFTDAGIIPKTASGSQTTYYCDGCWFASGTMYALVGGPCSTDGFVVGAFCVALGYAVSHPSWTFGASVSCKPAV